MIQRVQSIYLLLALVGLIIISLGFDVFSSKTIMGEAYQITSHANVYGIQKDLNIQGELTEVDENSIRLQMDRVEIEDVENVPVVYFPFYSITILLSMFSVVVLLGYKNLERQMKLGRLLFIFCLLTFIGTGILYYFYKNSIFLEGAEQSTSLGIGFFVLAASVAFVFLANTGVKRDLRLIKSIDRIR